MQITTTKPMSVTSNHFLLACLHRAKELAQKVSGGYFGIMSDDHWVHWKHFFFGARFITGISSRKSFILYTAAVLEAL